MRSNSSYIDSIDNLVASANDNCSTVNNYVLKKFGHLNYHIIYLLQKYVSFFYFLLVGFSFFKSIVDCFNESIHTILYKKKNINHLYNETIFLLFTPLLVDRSKASALYDNSQFWIISPEINLSKVNLKNKTIINYKDFGSLRLCYKSLKLCINTLYQLVLQKNRIYVKMYNLWEFYYCQLCIEKIVENNDIVFSNQSDRWALMFDRIKSKKKILCQHGINSDKYELPHKLHNIDVYYAISNSTWQNSYYSNLACTPVLKIMSSTIKLSEIENQGLTILIISNLQELEKQLEILNHLQRKFKFTAFIKKHPTENIDYYRIYQKDNSFILIENNVFPKVDFVISYFSTLAYEYLSLDIAVYMYTDKINETEVELLLSEVIKNKDTFT